jgi:hypothetical protein
MRLLKIRQLWLLFIMQFLFLMNGNAQYKSFKLNADGDTLNAINMSGQKQGKWVNHIDEVRGEPGYEEEGIYVKDKKEGIWRLYNLTGDLIGVENYEFGGKDGLQQYYTYLGDLIREENWRGYNPNAPFDTIPVYGAGNDEIIDYKIVKAEQYSVKHGEWKYYEPGSGRLVKVEKYDRGLLLKPDTAPAVATATDKPKKVDKTPEMIQWEKKNSGKKKALRDGRTSL